MEGQWRWNFQTYKNILKNIYNHQHYFARHVFVALLYGLIFESVTENGVLSEVQLTLMMILLMKIADLCHLDLQFGDLPLMSKHMPRTFVLDHLLIPHYQLVKFLIM